MRPFVRERKIRGQETTEKEDSGWKRNSIAKKEAVAINIAPKLP
jgi:hypothetical protein